MTVASVMQRMKSVLGKCFPTVRFDRIKNKEDVMLISASQQYKQAGNSIVVDVLAHIYEQLFYPAPPSHAPISSSLSSITPKTRCRPCRPPPPTRTKRRYSSPRSPATTRSSWQPTCYWSGIPIFDGRARDGATSTNMPVRCTTSSSLSFPTAPWATSPR